MNNKYNHCVQVDKTNSSLEFDLKAAKQKRVNLSTEQEEIYSPQDDMLSEFVEPH